jgi:hypothetical protein
LEKSQLLKTMQDICAAINAEAGTVIIDEHDFLPPEAVISSFAFSTGNTEYVMRLEVWGPRPSLVFVTRKWRDTSSNRLYRWIYQLAEVEPLRVNLKFCCEFQERMFLRRNQTVLYYLLSRLSRSYTPAFQTSKE